MIEQQVRTNLEQTLAKIEKDSDLLVRTVAEAATAVKKIRTAASVGDFQKLRHALNEANQFTAQLQQELASTTQSWNFDEEDYLGGLGFQQDLLSMAEQMGVDLIEHEGTLFAYPALVRVHPKEMAVTIDRVRETRLRPSLLVKRLKDLQTRPYRFKPHEFLAILYSAYSIAVGIRGKHLLGTGIVIPLMEIYELLTMLPRPTFEYTRQEFARDLYFLDKSGVNQTKKGHLLHFHASTGIKDATKVLSVIAQGGRLRTYYGTSFTSAA
ncbi:hypothetical protein [Candidatus Nitronereus thalassa]|uniref:Uncharacterized protein n=1 Tax=Candidatus Nitronereus thalassa TaxID=3020898 RepID=A0ABU3K6W4_9BACT|nr:hypothetical protein [Candidatus Nitronereus thalassa]MDT7042107.1 hypothetical protein [Candidatus Nitronereus thalassa]